MRMAALALIAMPLMAGCAGSAGTPAPATTAEAPKGAPTDAETLADALAAADRAAGADDAASLARSVARISALEPRPLDPDSAAQLAQWQSRVPDTPPLRGRTLGPGFRKGTLSAGGELRIEQTFLSGQKAAVALSTPDGLTLRLTVIDSAARPVCQNAASAPACEWIPIFTQRHVIQLTNPGPREARFYLVIE